MSILNELKWRGVINNITNESKIKDFEFNKSTVYAGFDPSFDSLHLGNYAIIVTLKRLSQAGHKVYAILGGATGLIGDPSGKKSERTMLDTNVVNKNVEAIKNQLHHFGDFEVINNIDFYKSMTMFDFLRNVGKLINVNYLLEKDIIKTRLETGISYSEFSYSLIQGYDFAWLYHHKNIIMQIGGADQWGNITTGIEMIRKLHGDDHKACGLTLNLLTKTDGTKFGKSEDGAIYLDAKYTSPHRMYQFLINQTDADVEKLLKVLTFYTQDEIKAIMKEHDNDKTQRYAQKKLADAIVGDVHSKTALAVATNVSRTLFTGDVSSLPPKELLEALSGTPTYKANGNKYTIVDLLVSAHVCSSKSNARQLITSKAISVNNKLIDSYDAIIDKADAIEHKFSYIKKGKKNYFLILWV